MPTYPQIDITHPVMTDIRDDVIDFTRNNGKGFRDAILNGQITDFSYSQTGLSAELPTTETLSSGTERLKATHTYSGNKRTQTVWEYSSDSGSTYATIETNTFTYDVSGNCVSGDTGGILSRNVNTLLARLLNHIVTYGNHVSTTSGAHGIQSMGLQTREDVDIRGGAIKATTIGGAGTDAKIATFLSVRERATNVSIVAGTPNIATLNLNNSGTFRINTAGVNFTLALSNVPSADDIFFGTLLVSNALGSIMTLPSGGTWGDAGAPAFSGNTDVLSFVVDGSSSYWAMAIKG